MSAFIKEKVDFAFLVICAESIGTIQGLVIILKKRKNSMSQAFLYSITCNRDNCNGEYNYLELLDLDELRAIRDEMNAYPPEFNIILYENEY